MTTETLVPVQPVESQADKTLEQDPVKVQRLVEEASKRIIEAHINSDTEPDQHGVVLKTDKGNYALTSATVGPSNSPITVFTAMVLGPSGSDPIKGYEFSESNRLGGSNGASALVLNEDKELVRRYYLKDETIESLIRAIGDGTILTGQARVDALKAE